MGIETCNKIEIIVISKLAIVVLQLFLVTNMLCRIIIMVDFYSFTKLISYAPYKHVWCMGD